MLHEQPQAACFMVITSINSSHFNLLLREAGVALFEKELSIVVSLEFLHRLFPYGQLVRSIAELEPGDLSNRKYLSVF